MTQNKIAHDLKHLTNRVVAARAAVRRGEVVQVSALQDETSRLCATVDELPAAGARDHRTLVIALLEEVDALTAALRAALDILREQLNGSGDRRRAMKAYGQPERGRRDAP